MQAPAPYIEIVARTKRFVTDKSGPIRESDIATRRDLHDPPHDTTTPGKPPGAPTGRRES